ncbi:hypothetical protein [Priestia endophytica]|uniref:hypothetical protein n=1 Tax=Priestia endophytica TaxID=135735 RepID=UPI002281A1B7|nr:hypothetical protein [Priestia endophytica]MCY8232891.1 hypothetical protein [Priestia endophytica]
MGELKGKIKKVEKELKNQLSQLGQEMNKQFNSINKQLDRIEEITNKSKKDTEKSIEEREALIERFKEEVLTSDDVLCIIDNLENGERLDLLNKLYDLYYNFNPDIPKGTEIAWD